MTQALYAHMNNKTIKKKKTSFQTYFNQVSLGKRHSGVNTPAQPREKKKKRKGGGGTTCSRNLEIWVVKKMTTAYFILS
jgi:hypothetical protein